ncbi:MAG: TlpA family protein disulfide reductase [bacterium]
MDTPAPAPRRPELRVRIAALLLVIGAFGLLLWRAQLFTVARPGDGPRPLAIVAPEAEPRAFAATLPVVPVGVMRVEPGTVPLLVHYWAPWERHSRNQITGLDSLATLLGSEQVRVVVVCFDPFPSVARYVRRHGVRSPVLLDLRRELQVALPCPSMPYTWLLDANGRVLVSQPGEVDWLAPGTRAAIEAARESAARTRTVREGT